MRMAFRFAPVAALALSFSLAAPAVHAEQEGRVPVQIGSALICDTQEQVQRFIALFEGDIQSALVRVNNEQPLPNSCDVATIAYVMGPQVATASTKTGSYRIVRVLVIGAVTEDGMTAAEPTPLYSVTRVEEREA